MSTSQFLRCFYMLFLIPFFAVTQPVLKYGEVLDKRQIKEDMDFFKTKLITPLSYSTTISNEVFTHPTLPIKYVGVGWEYKSFGFVAFSDYLNYSGSKKLTSESFDGMVTMYGIYAIANQMYMIYARKSSDNSQSEILAAVLTDNMVLEASPKLLKSIASNVKDEIIIKQSDDKSKILIVELDKRQKESGWHYKASVFDETFTELWTAELITEETVSDFQMKNIDIDNSGNLYLLGRTGKIKDSTLGLYSYQYQSKSWEKHPFKSDLADNLTCTLFMQSGEVPYVILMATGKKLAKYSVYQYDKSLFDLNHIITSNLFKDKRVYQNSFTTTSRSNWVINPMDVLNEGNLAFSIDYQKFTFKTRAIQVREQYAVSVNADGEEQWLQTIMRNQMITEMLFEQFCYVNEDRVYIIYNDNEKNLNKTLPSERFEQYLGKRGGIVVLEIDKDGLMKKYPLSTDPAMSGFNIARRSIVEIEKGYLSAQAIKYEGFMKFSTRNITIQFE